MSSIPAPQVGRSVSEQIATRSNGETLGSLSEGMETFIVGISAGLPASGEGGNVRVLAACDSVDGWRPTNGGVLAGD